MSPSDVTTGAFSPCRKNIAAGLTIFRRNTADLEGTLFRNGPGAMNTGAEAYGHWFDGPGMINAVTFHEGRAHFKNRYVRTPKFLSDRKLVASAAEDSAPRFAAAFSAIC